MRYDAFMSHGGDDERTTVDLREPRRADTAEATIVKPHDTTVDMEATSVQSPRPLQRPAPRGPEPTNTLDESDDEATRRVAKNPRARVPEPSLPPRAETALAVKVARKVPPQAKVALLLAGLGLVLLILDSGRGKDSRNNSPLSTIARWFKW